MEPGAVASEVARAAGIHTSQLFRWRQQLCERMQVATFNPVTISPEPALPTAPEKAVLMSATIWVRGIQAGRSVNIDARCRSAAPCR
jgi:transposase-like protein